MNEAVMEEEVELIDYLRVIWRRRRLILLGTFFCVVVAVVISFALPPVYEAEAQLRVGRVWGEEIENPYGITEQIDSDAFLDRVIERLHLSTTPYEMKNGKMIEARVIEGGPAGQKLPLFLALQAHAKDPRQAVDLANTVAQLLIEEHKGRFEENLKEHQSYERDLALQVASVAAEVKDLEKLLKLQRLKSATDALPLILLQTPLEQKSTQLLDLKRELKETRVKNGSSTVTEDTRLISPPVLPKKPISPRVKLNVAVAGVLGLFVALLLAFFLEYLEQVRLREAKGQKQGLAQAADLTRADV